MAQTRTWNIATKRIHEDRGALSKKDFDLVTDCKAPHDENLLTSWLRSDEEGRAERRSG